MYIILNKYLVILFLFIFYFFNKNIYLEKINNNEEDTFLKLYYYKYNFKMNNTIYKWNNRAKNIYRENRKQNIFIINNLNNKWTNNILLNNSISPWKLFTMLKNVIDLTDNNLLSTNQYYHSLQTFNNMLNDNITSEKLLFMGLYHDIGKLLVLFGEKQHNVMCSTYIIYSKKNDYCNNHLITSWGHDEFAYLKLKKYLEDDILWMIRYHSLIEFKNNNYSCILTKNEKINLYYLNLFYKYDKDKDIYNVYNYYNLSYAKYIIYKFIPHKIIF